MRSSLRRFSLSVRRCPPYDADHEDRMQNCQFQDIAILAEGQAQLTQAVSSGIPAEQTAT
jgi:hypothetical protein